MSTEYSEIWKRRPPLVTKPGDTDADTDHFIILYKKFQVVLVWTKAGGLHGRVVLIFRSFRH